MEIAPRFEHTAQREKLPSMKLITEMSSPFIPHTQNLVELHNFSTKN